MKYSKYIAVGMGLAVCFSSINITYGWFSSISNIQSNTIILHNPPESEDGEGYYTRNVDTVDCNSIINCGHKEFNFRFKYIGPGINDKNGNLMWNEDKEGNKYPISIDKISLSDAFAGGTLEFDKDSNKKNNFIKLKLNKKLDISKIPGNFDTYYMTMRVGVGENNIIDEYLEVGVRVKRISNHKIKAQWQIISRTPVDNIVPNQEDINTLPENNLDIIPGEADMNVSDELDISIDKKPNVEDVTSEFVDSVDESENIDSTPKENINEDEIKSEESSLIKNEEETDNK